MLSVYTIAFRETKSDIISDSISIITSDLFAKKLNPLLKELMLRQPMITFYSFLFLNLRKLLSMVILYFFTIFPQYRCLMVPCKSEHGLNKFIKPCSNVAYSVAPAKKKFYKETNTNRTLIKEPN